MSSQVILRKVNTSLGAGAAAAFEQPQAVVIQQAAQVLPIAAAVNEGYLSAEKKAHLLALQASGVHLGAKATKLASKVGLASLAASAAGAAGGAAGTAVGGPAGTAMGASIAATSGAIFAWNELGPYVDEVIDGVSQVAIDSGDSSVNASDKALGFFARKSEEIS